MSKLLQQFTKLFSKQPSALETFLANREIKTHAEVEYWIKYYEYQGL